MEPTETGTTSTKSEEDHSNDDHKEPAAIEQEGVSEVTTTPVEASKQFADVEQEEPIPVALKEEQEKSSQSIGGLDPVVVRTIEEHASIDDPVEPPARNAPKHTSMTNTSNNNHNNSDTKETDTELAFFPINSKSILSRLFDPDRKQKPQLWEHIKLVAPGPADQPPPGHIKWRSKDAVSAYCLKCRKQFTYTKGTSKTVSRHMQAYHGLVLNEDKDDSKPQSHSATAAGTTNAPPLKKRKMEQSAPILLLYWIVASFQPWSIVESTGMQDFVTCISQSSFVIPSKSQLLQLAMDTVERVKWEIRRLLKECDQYSLICHVFTPLSHHGNPQSSYSTSVTISFCTPTYELHQCCLGVLSTTLCDKESLQALLMEYSLPWNKLTHVTVTGMTETIDLALTTAKSDVCVLYQMNTLLQQTCQDHPVIMSLFSPDLLQTNHQSFIERAYNHTTTNTDTDTTMEFDHTTTTTTTRTTITGELKRLMLSAMASILKPFYDAHMTLSRESYPTVALTIPVFRRIRDVLAIVTMDNYAKENQDAQGVMEAFHKDLVYRFQTVFRDVLSDGVEEKQSQAPLWTIPTDPRLIHMGGLSDQEKDMVMEMLIHQVAEKKHASLGQTDNTKQASFHTTKGGMESKSIAKLDEPSTMGGIFWGDETGVDLEKDVLGSSHPADEEARLAYARTSLDQYFATVKSQRRIEDPLAWWNTHHSDFPELGEIARTWLAATAVGPPEDKRSRYDDEKLDLMVFLHDNAKLILTTT